MHTHPLPEQGPIINHRTRVVVLQQFVRCNPRSCSNSPWWRYPSGRDEVVVGVRCRVQVDRGQGTEDALDWVVDKR